MDLAENRFGKTWKHFLEVLKVDYNCSLAECHGKGNQRW